MKRLFSLKVRLGATIGALGLMSLGVPSRAQDYGVFNMGMLTNTLSMDAITQSEAKRAKAMGQDSGIRRAPSITTTKKAPRVNVNTNYRAQPEVTARVKAQYVRYVAKMSPDAGRKVASDMKRYDPTKIWAGIVAEDGLKPYDLADSLTGYYVLNWLIANKRTGVSRPSVANVRRQFKTILLSNASAARLSNAKKQEMAEILNLNFLYQQKMFTQAIATKNQTLLQNLSNAASSRFRSDMKLDPRKLKIGSAGFQAA